MDPRIIGLTLVWLAMLLEAFGQLFLKRAADRSADGARPFGLLRSLWRNRCLLAGIACFLADGVLWTGALSLLDLSVAFPAGSICFVFVALLSSLFLHERVGPGRWVGIGLILSGVALIWVQ